MLEDKNQFSFLQQRTLLGFTKEGNDKLSKVSYATTLTFREPMRQLNSQATGLMSERALSSASGQSVGEEDLFIVLGVLMACLWALFMCCAEQRRTRPRPLVVVVPTTERSPSDSGKRRTMIEQKLTVYEWTDDSVLSQSDGVVAKSEMGTAVVVFVDADETGTVEHRMERLRKLSKLSAYTRRKGRQVCAICLALFENHQRVCESNNTDCRHSFHVECMTQWLLKHSSCPVCRVSYLTEVPEPISKAEAQMTG